MDWEACMEHVEEKSLEITAICHDFNAKHPGLEAQATAENYPPRVEVSVVAKPEDGHRVEVFNCHRGPVAQHLTPFERECCGDLARRIHIETGLRVWRERYAKESYEERYTFKPDYGEFENED